MPTISGDYNKMINDGNRLKTIASKIGIELHRLDESLLPLQQSFIGERASGFFTQYTNFSENMYQLRDVITNFGDQLITAGNRLKEADKG